MVDCIDGKFLKNAAAIITKRAQKQYEDDECPLGMLMTPNGECAAFWSPGRVFYDCEGILREVIRVARLELGIALSDPVDMNTRIQPLRPGEADAGTTDEGLYTRLKFIKLLAGLEEELRVRFSPDVEKGISTIGDVVKTVESMKGCKKE